MSPAEKISVKAFWEAVEQRLRQNRPAAQALVNEIGQRFPRHRAFQTELQAALQRMECDLR